MLMGILTENFSPAALRVFASSMLQISYFRCFSPPFFIKNTMVVRHIDIFIENNFFGSFLLQDDPKKILFNINFWP
jgi:hypothetical protein